MKHVILSVGGGGEGCEGVTKRMPFVEGSWVPPARPFGRSSGSLLRDEVASATV